nr:FlhC family transcriptional regulator [Microbulbifer elongatus]
MTEKSLLNEMQQVQLAIELIELNARLQVLESETDLSRGRLIRLYKEVRGMSPPKGMLPFSTDWFTTWMPNIHSSLFYGIYLRLTQEQGCDAWRASSKHIACIWSWQTMKMMSRCSA